MEKDLIKEKEVIRKESYQRKKKELEKICNKCKMCSIERCNDCTTGRRFRYLEIEYSDVTGWSHDYWCGNKI